MIDMEEFEEALTRRFANCTLLPSLPGQYRLVVTRIAQEGPPARIEVDNIDGSLSGVFTEFKRLYPEWFE